jgi:hypothetical protein
MIPNEYNWIARSRDLSRLLDGPVAEDQWAVLENCFWRFSAQGCAIVTHWDLKRALDGASMAT